MNMTGEPVAEDGLPPWEDSRVQIVYEMLCDANLRSPNPEEHWEGWISRNIVRALSRPVEAAPVAEGLEALLLLPVEAINALESHQRQIDRDGVEVGVSRQAVDEIVAAVKGTRRPLSPRRGRR